MGVPQIYLQFEEELIKSKIKPLFVHIFENNIKETSLQISKLALRETDIRHGYALRQFEQKRRELLFRVLCVTIFVISFTTFAA